MVNVRTLWAVAFAVAFAGGCNAILGNDPHGFGPSDDTDAAQPDATMPLTEGGAVTVDGAADSSRADASLADAQAEPDALAAIDSSTDAAALDGFAESPDAGTEAGSDDAAAADAVAPVGCAADAVRCSGSQPQTCDEAGIWQNDPGGACPYLCADGGCTGACAPGTSQCAGLQPQTCDDAGAWEDGDAGACPFNCQAGLCTGACAAGSQDCNGLQPETCTDAGQFASSGSQCPNVCDGGACTGVCSPGAQRCSLTNSLQPQVCDGTGQWQDQGSPCTGGVCNGGTCAACAASTTRCNSLQPQVCTSGVWTDNGSPCPNVCSGGTCTGVCSPGSKQCGGTSNLQPQLCDGTGTWQPNGSACPYVCSGGTCSGTCVPGTFSCNGAQPEQCDTTGALVPYGGACAGCTACRGSDGTCQPSSGATCNDNNPCTQSDTCLNGVCSGSDPVTCSALDQCHVAGSCSAATGKCSNPVAADNTPCNADNNLCTIGDACRSGTCVAGQQATCSPTDQCHTAGSCTPSSGECTNPPAPNNTSCNDGNGCTTGDVCTNGVCAGTAACNSPPDACHSASGTCNPSAETCQYPLASGVVCATGETCSNWYQDCDSDGSGDASAVPFHSCEPPSVPPAACPSGTWSPYNTDCCDFDNRAYPGEDTCNGANCQNSGFYTVADVCGSYDYDCSGSGSPLYSATDCNPMPESCAILEGSCAPSAQPLGSDCSGQYYNYVWNGCGQPVAVSFEFCNNNGMNPDGTVACTPGIATGQIAAEPCR